MVRTLITLAAAGVLALAGCGGPKLPPSLQGPLKVQTRMTAYGEVLAYWNPTDLPDAQTWRPGEKQVTIAGLHPKAITVEDEDGDTYYLFPEKGGFWQTDQAEKWMPKFFAQDAPAITPAVKQALEAGGKPQPGMTKEEVAVVAGWPTMVGVGRPMLNQPKSAILAEDVWRFRTRYKADTTIEARFKDGKLLAAP